MNARPRAVFFGTPSFAVPCLAALTEVADVVAVVCQPDKPVGRGNVVTAPPVKRWAEERAIPVVQPVKLRDGTFAAWLRGVAPDVAVVVAYGRILPPDVLTVPPLGCVNVHASVLPRHRGAAPINWSILTGDDATGVTLMQMDEGLDTGPALAVRHTPIALDDTAIEVSQRLQDLGAALLREELPRLVAGALTPAAQDNDRATHAPLLTKEMARIDWLRSARQVHDHVRGLQPWPGASTTLGARRLIVGATALDGPPAVLGGAPGEVVALTRDRIWVATAAGLVAITELQLEGKKRMPVREFVGGHPMRTGTMLGTE
jgi:methionyl-tRNA formyltransferase